MRKIILFCFLLLSLAIAKNSDNPCTNQQVHISLAEYYSTLNPHDPMLKIAFHTKKDACMNNHVLLHLGGGSTQKIPATSRKFQATYDSEPYQTYVHYASVGNIKFDTVYTYEIFNEGTKRYEGPFTFKVPSPTPTPRTRNFMLYGDMDYSTESQQTLSYLKKMSKSMDLFFHVGDLAYDLEKKGGKRGDDFMNGIQDIAANVPYMVTMGNHEAYNNFSNFNMRFQMPFYQYTQNHLYSINVDNVHFVSIDLELPVLQPQYLSNVVNWLERDLRAANANRAQRPWIIVYGHRPIYCSGKEENDDCINNPTRFHAIEEVMYRYGVDIYFSGHVHVYERNLPVYKGNVMPFTKRHSDTGNHYIQDPQAPMYIVAGIPGHKDFPANKKLYPVKNFCARLDRDYSVGMISVQNNTHLLWQMIHTKTGKTEDFVYLIKTKTSYLSKSSHHFLEEAQDEATISLSMQVSSERYELYWICLAVIAVAVLVYVSRSKKVHSTKQSTIENDLAANIVN